MNDSADTGFVSACVMYTSMHIVVIILRIGICHNLTKEDIIRPDIKVAVNIWGQQNGDQSCSTEVFITTYST